LQQFCEEKEMTNVNYRTRNPTGLHITPGTKPLMPDNEFQALRNAKPAEPKPGKINARQLQRVQEYLPHIRRCQKRGHRPRSVPREVLELMIAFQLVTERTR
jgi:hypothetical protein